MDNRLRRMADRIRSCQLNNIQNRLMYSVLGLDEKTILPTLYAHAARAWPELPTKYYKEQAGSNPREALKKIERACSLSLPERLMLKKLDAFYEDLEKKFPSYLYNEIEKLAHRFRINRGGRGKQPLFLTEKQVKIATRLLGLNGTPPFRETIFALCREFLPESADTADVRSLYALYKQEPRSIFRKIQRAWNLSEEKYCELLSANTWYKSLSERFPERTPLALTAIKDFLQVYPINALQRRREEERKTLITFYHTPLWYQLSTRDQEILVLYYNLDTAAQNTKTTGQIARILGIDGSTASAKIQHAKDRLIEIDPSLPLRVHNETSYAGSIWIRYRREVLAHPILDDTAIQTHVTAMRSGDTRSRDALFYFGIRFIFPIAKKWSSRAYIRVWRDAGQTLLDLIQEANIGLYSALPSFIGTTADEFRQFSEYTSEKAIKIALRYQGVPIRISQELSNSIRRTNKTWKNLFCELRREPTTEEIAMHLRVSTTEIEETLQTMRVSVVPTRSLDAPLNEEDDDRTLYDIVSDSTAADEPEAILRDRTAEQQQKYVEDALEYALMFTITGMEQNVLTLRFGMNNEGTEMQIPAVAAKLQISEKEALHVLETAIWKLRSDPKLQIAFQQFNFWSDKETP